jgi:hypothetical protein
MQAFRTRLRVKERKTAQIFVLPGIERRDLVGDDVPSALVLQAAIDNGITDVVVVGRKRNGGRYLAGETRDVDRTVGILMSAVDFMVSGSFMQGSTNDDR